MVLGYVRVSSSVQDVQKQEHEILTWANSKKMSVDDWIKVESSSRNTLIERRVDELLTRLKKGDTLIVSELSRIGRSIVEVIEVINRLSTNKVRIIAIKQGLDISTKPDMQTKVLVSVFSLLAELERDLISERTKQALAAVKATGKKLGKPKGTIQGSKLDIHREEIKKLLEKKVAKAAIARIFGCSRQALIDYVKSRKLA